MHGRHVKETMTDSGLCHFFAISTLVLLSLSYTFQTVFANLYDKTRSGTVYRRHVKETMTEWTLSFGARSTAVYSFSYCHTHFKQSLPICMIRQVVERVWMIVNGSMTDSGLDQGKQADRSNMIQTMTSSFFHLFISFFLLSQQN